MPSYVVTGASRGIGLEFVRQLSNDPQNIVFALVRNKATALAVPDSPLKDNFSNVHVLEADVTDFKALKLAAEKVAEVTGGGLDVLINNAAALNGDNDWRGLLDFLGEEELLEQEFAHHFKVNVNGVIHCTNSFFPLLRKGALKKVVIISSVGGERGFVFQTGFTGLCAYGASKAAVNMILTKYAIELKDEGFICFALSPGLVDTSATSKEIPSPKHAEWAGKIMDNFKRTLPNHPRILTPEQSVKMQLDFISDSTHEDNGAFHSIW